MVGRLSLDKRHVLASGTNSFAVSEKLRGLCCLVGQAESYDQASNALKEIGGIKISGMQIQRICTHYGGLLDQYTLVKDRTVKAAVYANAGIAEYWIINLIERQIEVYTEPSDTVAEYQASVIYQEQDEIEHGILGAFPVLNSLP